MSEQDPTVKESEESTSLPPDYDAPGQVDYPDPAFEDEHATRVSDLRVYVRQHHAERDTAALGRAAARDQPW